MLLLINMTLKNQHFRVRFWGRGGGHQKAYAVYAFINVDNCKRPLYNNIHPVCFLIIMSFSRPCFSFPATGQGHQSIDVHGQGRFPPQGRMAVARADITRAGQGHESVTSDHDPETEIIADMGKCENVLFLLILYRF